MIPSLYFFESKSITGAALFLAGSAFLSRLLGLLRDRLLAGTFGAGPELDVYFAAFRIPDFIFAVFVLGGVSAVFLPMFSERRERGEGEAWLFVNSLLHVLLVGLGLLAALLFITAPLLMRVVAPGFTGEQLETGTALTRLMLLSPILFGLSSVFTGMLQYFNRFLAYAAAPVFYNLGIIFGIVFLAPVYGVWGVALGVVGGAALHLLIQVPAARRAGWRWSAVWRPREAGVMRALRLLGPRTIGGAAYQVNLIVMTAFASLLSAGSIAIFTFADNLQSAPVGMVAIPLALAAFPALSRAAARKEVQAFWNTLRGTLRKVVILVFPGSLALFLLREEVIRLIYQTGALKHQDVELVAAVFGVFITGVLFQALIPVLVRSFFALQDTKTPTVAGVAAVLLNIALAGAFLQLFSSFGDYRIVALPLALVVSGAFQCLLLALFLWKRILRELS